MLLELRADEADGERATVDRRRHAGFAKDERQRANVVLVAMRENDRLDVVGAIAQVREIRQHEVDSKHVGGWKHQPGIDHDDAAVGLDDSHVLADLAEATERQDANGSRHSTAPSPDPPVCI